MSFETDLSADGRVLTFKMSGTVDLSMYRKMKEAANDYANVSYAVDFCNNARMQDSGLGMLVSLSQKNNKEIELINCTPEISSRVKRSTFNSRFKISG